MTQPDGTGQPDAQQQPAGISPASAAALAALAVGAPDPFLPLRWRRLAALVRAEHSLHARYAAALSGWLAGVRGKVLRHGAIDFHAPTFAAASWDRAVDEMVQVQVREIFDGAFHEAGGWEPDGLAYARRYLTTARNRMVVTPDSVYQMVVEHTRKAIDEGWPIDELAARIGTLLADEGMSTWANRGLVVARTEAIAAYNAGTFAGYQSLADQDGEAYEKGWLATHDTRVRPTHLAADIGTPETGQRVPLAEPFAVDEAHLMFPGDPSGPPDEVIQCRCSLVLLKPGEEINLAGRFARGRP